MKKRYRDKALNAVFASLDSADFDEREYALFQLAMLLGRVNRAGRRRDLPEADSDSLPRDLRRLRLGAEEQRRIVERLSLLIAAQRENRATAFWTLGQVSAAAGWQPTLTLIAAFGAQLDRESAYQTCRALHRWLAGDELPRTEIPESGAVAQLLASWAEADDIRLSMVAKAALMEIGKRSA